MAWQRDRELLVEQRQHAGTTQGKALSGLNEEPIILDLVVTSDDVQIIDERVLTAMH